MTPIRKTLLFGILFLGVSALQAQVAKPKPETPDRAPVRTIKKASIEVKWTGSSTYKFTFKVNNSTVEEYIESGQSKIITITPGFLAVTGESKGNKVHSEFIEVDAGRGNLVMSLNGKEIILKYESDEQIKEREREARERKEEEERRERLANEKKAQGYMDKAFDYIGSGRCDDAMTYYRYASGLLPSSDSELQNLYKQVENCKTKNAFENMVSEADNYKRRGYLETALGKYKESLKLKPRDYQVSQKINDIERDMSQARAYEAEGDRYMKQKKYDAAMNSYSRAKNLWGMKSGIQNSYEEAAYLAKKASGLEALTNGNYKEAVDLLKAASETSRGGKDSDLKEKLKEAQYQYEKEQGDKNFARGDYSDAYENYFNAKSFKENDEITELTQKALVKMFEAEYEDVIIKDKVESYEAFLQRWNSIPRDKELLILNRLIDQEMSKGRTSFFNKGYYRGHFSNAKKWIDKADPEKSRMRERRIINTYLEYSPAPRGFSANYCLPLMLGFSSTTTQENLNDVNAPLPFPKPSLSNISREKFFFTTKFNGGIKYQDEVLMPFGERFLSFPVGLGAEFFNNTVSDASMTSLKDPQSDTYSPNPNYSAYQDTIASYKKDNAWGDSYFSFDLNAGYSLSSFDLIGRIHIIYNLQKVSFNPYQSCTECGGDLNFDRNFLSTGISISWRNRIELSYFGKGGLYRGELDNPENRAFLFRAELFFGDYDARTRFSFRGEYFKASLYNPLPASTEPIHVLKQFRLFPTLNFQF